MPQVLGREAEEETGWKDDQKAGRQVHRPIIGVLPASTEGEFGVTREVLKVLFQFTRRMMVVSWQSSDV